MVVLAEGLNQALVRFPIRLHRICPMFGSLRELLLFHLSVYLSRLRVWVLVLDDISDYLGSVEAKFLHGSYDLLIELIILHVLLLVLLRFDYHYIPGAYYVLLLVLLVGLRTLDHDLLLRLLSVAAHHSTSWGADSRLRIHDDVINYVEVVINHTPRALEGLRRGWGAEDLRGRLVRTTCGGQLWGLGGEGEGARRLGWLLQQGYFRWRASLESSLSVVEGSAPWIETTNITLTLSCVHEGGVLEEVIVVWVLNGTTATHPKVSS